jgi:hypothetical protein
MIRADTSTHGEDFASTLPSLTTSTSHRKTGACSCRATCSILFSRPRGHPRIPIPSVERVRGRLIWSLAISEGSVEPPTILSRHNPSPRHQFQESRRHRMWQSRERCQIRRGTKVDRILPSEAKGGKRWCCSALKRIVRFRSSSSDGSGRPLSYSGSSRNRTSH